MVTTNGDGGMYFAHSRCGHMHLIRKYAAAAIPVEP
jgi:hypothetical protein